VGNPLQNYVDTQGPVVDAAWLNGVDVLANSVFNSAQTTPAARAALFSDLPNEIANGGTAARTAAQALSNLGGTTLAVAVAAALAALTPQIIGFVTYPIDTAIGENGTNVVNPQYIYGHVWRYGAVGDGVTDDTAALNAAGLINFPLYIPYTPGNGYKITSTVTFNQNVQCDGQLYAVGIVSNSGQSSGSWTATSPAVKIHNSALAGNLGARLRIKGLFVEGDANAKANNTIGVLVDGNGHVLDQCGAAQCGFGCVVRGFILQFQNCTFGVNNTGMSMYSPSSTFPINSILVCGGNYGGNANYALNIGDMRFSSAVSLGTPQGVCIRLEGFNCDQSSVAIDNVAAVSAKNVYFEFTSTGTAAFILGGSGANNLNDVDIGTCFFNNVTYAIQCLASIGSLKVRANFYNGVTMAVQYFDCQNQGAYYEAGSSAGSFVNSAQVCYAFPGQTVGTLSFGGITNTVDSLYNGVQYSINPITKWYPGAAQLNSGNRTINTSSLHGVFYSSPASNKAGGVLSGQNTVQMSTISDSYSFNGGDRIVVTTVSGGANAAAAIVVSVNYVTGVITVDANATGTGTVTISQQTASTATAA
jgi:hypothetical protein